MGEVCERLYGAHCYVAPPRGPAGAAGARPSQRGCGFTVASASHRRREAVLTSSTGQAANAYAADAVIGADGIHSTIRETIAPGAEARFSGLCAFRCLVPRERAPAMALRPVQTLWLGPGRHFVHYPISGGRLVNVVAIVPAGDWRTESWTAEGKVADMAREFVRWDGRLQQLVDSATETKRWALYDRSPLERWTFGRVTLAGDAAHPMYPRGSNGAAQSAIDARTLADAFVTRNRCDAQYEAPAATLRGNPPDARERVVRQPRARSQESPAGWTRNSSSAMPSSPAATCCQSAWLYGHGHESNELYFLTVARLSLRSCCCHRELQAV
jgi:salicylate hydroxylase